MAAGRARSGAAVDTFSETRQAIARPPSLAWVPASRPGRRCGERGLCGERNLVDTREETIAVDTDPKPEGDRQRDVCTDTVMSPFGSRIRLRERFDEHGE